MSMEKKNFQFMSTKIPVMDFGAVEIHRDAVIIKRHGTGEQFLVRFPNGYGASILQNQYSYGVELAVIHWTDEEDFELVYDTPVTGDVIGHNTSESLREHLEEIRTLPKRRKNLSE